MILRTTEKTKKKDYTRPSLFLLPQVSYFAFFLARFLYSLFFLRPGQLLGEQQRIIVIAQRRVAIERRTIAIAQRRVAFAQRIAIARRRIAAAQEIIAIARRTIAIAR